MKNRTYLIAGILAVIQSIIILYLAIVTKMALQPGANLIFLIPIAILILGIYYVISGCKDKKDSKLIAYSAVIQIVAEIILFLGVLFQLGLFYIQGIKEIESFIVVFLILGLSWILSIISIIIFFVGLIKRRLEK